MSGYTIVGKRVPAKDAVPKVTGQAKYGAKEGDEGTAIAMAPTIANAIYDAVGVRITSLPITPEKVLRALQGEPWEKKGGKTSDKRQMRGVNSLKVYPDYICPGLSRHKPWRP